MVMTNGSDETERVRKFISDTVRTHWDRENRAMLLSVLGLQVRGAFPDAYLIMPDGLKNFLVQWPVVQVVQHPTIRESVGAVPLDVKVPENALELFMTRAGRPAGLSQLDGDFQSQATMSQPRYDRAFWRAFHTPLTGRRFVIPPDANNGTVRVVETTDGSQVPNAYEILTSDVALLPMQAPLTDKVQETVRKIQGWLARNELSPELFCVPHVPRRTLTQVHYADQRASSVALALAKLDSSDQARILVPLDIVAKIVASTR